MTPPVFKPKLNEQGDKMKHKLPDLKEFKTTAQALFKGEISIEDIQEVVQDRHQEKIFQISQAIPNPMADIPETRKLIVLIDIVGFSKSSTREQVYNIYLFQRYLVSKVLSSKMIHSDKKIKIRNFIPTGDGCYIIAEECEPEIALDFLISLIGGFKEITNGNEKQLSLRASALIGSGVPFIDIARHLNFVGDGMNEAARILSGGQKVLEDLFKSENPAVSDAEAKLYSRNSLYLGDSLAEKIEDYSEECNKIFCFENVSDKHGKTRNITVLHRIWD